MKKQNESLFDIDEGTIQKSEWVGMPEFVQEDLSPFKSVVVHFATNEDLKKFAQITGQRIGLKTQSIWYPEQEIGKMSNKRFNRDE